MNHTDDMLIIHGDAIKALGDNRVGGYLVRFSGPGDPDRQGDFFTAKTDFDFEDGDRRSVYYHHGLDKSVGTRKLGRAALSMKSDGVWAEAELNDDEIAAGVMAEVKSDRISWSSGAPNHLVRRKAVGPSQEVVHWPIAEASLTRRPVEPRARAFALKCLQDDGEVADATDAEIYAYKSQAEVTTAIEDILRAKMPLAWHLESARAAVKSAEQRVAEFLTTRCIKSGRVLSQENHSIFTGYCDSLESIAGDMRGKLAEHAPEAKADVAPPPPAITDAEMQQAMARYAETMARLSGVPV